MGQGVYAELHCHSAFSLGDGASTPEALASRAAELEYTHLALTDHDDMGGAVRFSRACENAGITPVLGAETTLSGGYHLTLLVENVQGWKNLCSLISAARMGHPRGAPALSADALAERSEGLVALSGCPRGRIPTLLARGDAAGARAEAGRMREIFGDRFHLELWDHRTHGEASLCADLHDLAAGLGIPWTVTHNVHYAEPAGRAVHDLLACTRRGLTLDEAHRTGVLRPSAEWCLQPPAEMARRWRTAPGAIRRTLEIAERCSSFRLRDLPPAAPPYPLPSGRDSADGYLAELARVGLAERLPGASPAHHAQLAHELAAIASVGMANHFLVVWDVCRFAREAGIMCQGRGSAANSLVCYALRVTAVDPVAHGLLFERFLSPERPEPPDIDIDFAADEARERVLQYVYERYGRGHAAMVCTHVEFRGRSALRDAMRVLAFPATTADALAKQLDGHASARVAAEWLDAGEGKALRSIGMEPDEPRARALVRLVAGLDGLPRQRGIHSGGFVLSGTPLGEHVPIEPASMPGRTVIQWDKDDCADARIPKFDFLGLGMLRLLGECVELVRSTRGVEIDLGRLPTDDADVYAGITAADTVGLFQIESRAQANFLPRLRPTTFYDLVIAVGAIRPGPMLGGQVKEMLARRRGTVATEYPHPDLEAVLGRTHGMALFQEQLMRCAIVVSGCTAGEADRLRRAMSRKRSREEMALATGGIRERMSARGVDPEAAERVLGWLEACASYTFPESHAISFALLAYASAWLRLRYPAEYLCAILNAQPMGFYPVSTLVHDARAHGVRVLGIDLAHSAWECTMEKQGIGDRGQGTAIGCAPDAVALGPLPPGPPPPNCWGRGEDGAFGAAESDGAASRGDDTSGCPLSPVPCPLSVGCPLSPVPCSLSVRMGLRFVRGLGSGAAGRLRAELERGPFTSVADAVERIGGEAELRALAAAGAFRSWIPGGPRAALWEVLGELRQRRSGGPLAPAAPPEARLPVPGPAAATIMAHHATGVDLDGHPMRHLRERLGGLGVLTAAELRGSTLRHGARVSVAGLVVVRQRPGTAKGFVFLGLEDETGRIDVIITPALYAEERAIINGSGILAVRGRLGKEDGVTNLRAETFFPLALETAGQVVRSHDYH